MPQTSVEISHEVVIEIGGVPIALHTSDPEFVDILSARFSDYFKAGMTPEFTFDVDLVPPGMFDVDADAEVWLENGQWRMERGDFRATWDPATRQGLIRQSPNPYSIDSVLRICHTLVLAHSGGFLLHASSDVELLTDEASYVRKVGAQYRAYGTPFAGEFGAPGKNISAPIAAVYLLAKGPENRITPVEPAEAIRRLMRNILFFAHDAELVRLVFDACCAFVATVPVYQLTFFPDQRVWELIG